jgi:uncharacterized protein YjaZ
MSLFRPRIFLLSSEECKLSPKTRDTLVSTVRLHAALAMTKLQIRNDVNFTIYLKRAWTIEVTGDGGYTPAYDWVQIYIDLTGDTHSALSVIEERLPATVYHEVHHCKRWLTTGFGSKLIDEIVTEGLACAFEYQQWNKNGRRFLFELDGRSAVGYIEILKSLLKNPDYQYTRERWFIRGDDKIPKWFGYKVGFYIVQNALRNNANKNILDLTSLASADILSLSGIKM